MFSNGPGGQGSIPGHVMPKTLKMVLDTSLLNTQQLSSSVICFLTVLEFFLYPFEQLRVLVFDYLAHLAIQMVDFLDIFSMNFYGIKTWRPMLLTNNSTVSNIGIWNWFYPLLSLSLVFVFLENDKLVFY